MQNAFCQFVGSLSAAWAVSNEGWDNNSFGYDFSQYQYAAENWHQSNPLWSLFLGYEGVLTDEWAVQLGVAYFSQSRFTVKGTLTQGVDPQSSDQFQFQYRLQSQQLLIDSKWLYYWREFMHPYILIGIGGSYNQAYNYEVNVPVCTTFSPLFQNHNRYALAWSVGFGIDFELTPKIRAGLAYRFFDFGKSELNDSFIDTIPTRNSYSQSHLYQNVFMGQFTYLI